ncbi:MAG: bifunctional 2-polyprenyl-6-hydroxyphenol methylase/3-demethylubiquinol 3-O-methyltransferase UbiG [Rhodospirillales bacterium]|nr:bifunctional 2-polyprenyl-6-hydroxyphenol methylase/3-demethylubiquinol 3-O-methyltransferase UbiG [Rhodospirillales bacterium]
MATQQADRATPAAGGTVDPDEIETFSAVADRWWDRNGPFRPLHRLNPIRLSYLRDSLAGHFDRDTAEERPLSGLAIADVGCGGGLITEPLARLGATMTGIDASDEAIAVARAHAGTSGLAIDYRASTVEQLADGGTAFDAVVALEIVEHVADRAAFIAAFCRCVRPGGLIILSTLNRTARSFALGIVGAEYVLRWVPRGTHTWLKFVKPSELARDLRASGASVEDVTGLVFNPLNNRWHLGRDIAVNYMLRARLPESAG